MGNNIRYSLKPNFGLSADCRLRIKDYSISAGQLNGPEDLEQYLVKDLRTRKYNCSICNIFSHHSKTNARNHVESKHFKGCFTYTCDFCGKTLSTKLALENHRNYVHERKGVEDAGR